MISNISGKNTFRLAIIFFALSFTFFVANIKGKIDARKVQYGYEFNYNSEDKFLGYKYLERANNYVFYLNDAHYISEENDSLDFSNFNYGLGFIIKNTDKDDIVMGYYKTGYTSNTKLFYDTFKARNILLKDSVK